MTPTFRTPEATRASVRADLDELDAAYARLRDTSTDLVGNAFRLLVAERLETQRRVNGGLSYRIFGELADPPDGDDRPIGGPGVKLRDTLAHRLRLTTTEVGRRFRMAARLTARRSLAGPPRPPELPVLAEAVAEGAVGEDHIREVCEALRGLPAAVGTDERDRAEVTLVEHARRQDARFVEEIGRKLAEVLNPDGHFDEADRLAKASLVLGRQRPDGMSRLTGWLTPEARAYFEAVDAAMRPGHHMPDAERVVGKTVDTRTPCRRRHDALAWGLRTALESGGLGTHRGVPVTVIATASVDQLEQAARAAVDPNVSMPPPARTGGGSALPMRDLIRMASNTIHYLAVFDSHSERPLYLGRSTRIATADQRVACHARDKGCTRPNCTVWGYYCEVHHAPDWQPDGATDADKLYFACGPDHALVTDGHACTTVSPDGRLAWAIGDAPPEVNRLHHDDEILAEPEPEPEPESEPG